MGIFDRLKKPFGKKERIETPKTIGQDLPEDLAQFKERVGSDPHIPDDNPPDLDDPAAGEFESEARSATDVRPKSLHSGSEYLPSEFGLGEQKPLEKPLTHDQDTRFREKVDTRHTVELILSKLETIDARLKVIEERMRR